MTTFKATAQHDGKWWAVRVADVPGYAVHTQGRDLTEAEYMARDAVALSLDVSIDDIEVDLVVTELAEPLTELEQARSAADRVQDLLTALARRLADEGVSVKDSAHILKLSPGRVNQLRSKAAA